MTTETTEAPPLDPRLTKLIVAVVPQAMAALDRAADLTGDTRTDTVNRAPQAYATLLEAALDGRPSRISFDPFDDGRPARLLVWPFPREPRRRWWRWSR